MLPADSGAAVRFTTASPVTAADVIAVVPRLVFPEVRAARRVRLMAVLAVLIGVVSAAAMVAALVVLR